jgi:hypothetical protein
LKIALIGSAPSSIRLAPYADPTWQIWGCSPGAYPQVPRSNAWFELHRWEPPVIGKPDQQRPWFTPEYCMWMAAHPRVIMQEKVAQIPKSERIDKEGLTRRYGHYNFTSSLAWMFAMAIDDIRAARAKRKEIVRPEGEPEEEDAIGLWGVDMAACTSADTKVLTADLRWVRADSLKVGEWLLAFDEEPQPNGGAIPQRRWRSSQVLEASRLTKPCYRLTLEDGRELVCSEDHKWLTYAENECRWKEARDLVTPQHRDDRPTKIVKLMDVWSEDKSWEAGYLAAAFDGEGHLTQNLRNGMNGVLRAGFAQRDNVMLESVQRAMQERGFALTLDSIDGQIEGCHKLTVKGGRVENLRFLGSIRPRRLLHGFRPDDLGMMHKSGTVAVVKAEFIGDYPVIGLRTTTKTFVAEGLASHNTEEYGYQRSGCQFFAQIAGALRIPVHLPPESDLMVPPPLYGVCEGDHMHIKMLERKRELEGRLAQATSNLKNMETQVMFLKGALDDIDYCMNTWLHKGDAYGTNFGAIFEDVVLDMVRERQQTEEVVIDPITGEHPEAT